MDLMGIYRKLLERYGERHWWPADSKFEVIVGAILTQQTTWRNVERAIAYLKADNMLELSKLAKIDIERLETLIRSTGFYRQKAKRLKNACIYLYAKYGARLDELFDKSIEAARSELLALHGIGEETADSILLYAGNKLKFVVDAYTLRICDRLGLIRLKDYGTAQTFFERELPKDIEVYKDFHALLVELGKRHCRAKPLCEGCPLNDFCWLGGLRPP